MSLNQLECVQDMSEILWGSGQHLHLGIEALRLSFFDALSVSKAQELIQFAAIMNRAQMFF